MGTPGASWELLSLPRELQDRGESGGNLSLNAALKFRVRAAESKARPHSCLKELSALIVDDDLLTRETLKGMLLRLGMGSLREASHGKEALSLLENGGVDLVLTDIHMPVMDGMALLEAVKEKWPAVPVVVVSGYPVIETAVEAMKKGASDFILKPFKLDQMELPLQRAARERRLLLENSRLSKELAQKREIERLNRYLQRKLQELSKLYAISEGMQPGHLQGENLFQRIVEMAAEITEARKASLMLLDEEKKCLVIKAGLGMDQELRSRRSLPLGKGIPGKVAMEGRAVMLKGRPGMGSAGKGEGKGGSMVCVPLHIGGEVFGVLSVAEKASGRGFGKEDLALLTALAQKAALAMENQALHESIHTTLTDTLVSLVSTIEARDPYTRDHSHRVTQWAVRIARKMGFPTEELDMLRFAGYLHDIGKIGIRDSILMKPCGLTAEEISIIRTHPIIGERIVKPLGLLPLERSVIRHHHERWDGKGYPDGLKGEEIPLAARILAVADGFDAMTSDRVYRRGRPPEEALKEIERLAGIQFDRNVVVAFKWAFEAARKAQHT